MVYFCSLDRFDYKSIKKTQVLFVNSLTPVHVGHGTQQNMTKKLKSFFDLLLALNLNGDILVYQNWKVLKENWDYESKGIYILNRVLSQSFKHLEILILFINPLQLMKWFLDFFYLRLCFYWFILLVEHRTSPKTKSHKHNGHSKTKSYRKSRGNK